MTKRLAPGRTCTLGVCVVALVLAAICAIQSYKWNAQFLRWFDDVPMRVRLTPNHHKKYETEYRQTCEISHGAYLILDETLPPEKFNEKVAGLASLRGTFELSNGTIEKTQVLEFNGKKLEYRLGRIALLRIPPARNGVYVARIEFSDGMTELSGQTNELVAKYELCGLENLPSQFMGWLAITLSVIGTIGMALVIPYVLERGFYINYTKTIA